MYIAKFQNLLKGTFIVQTLDWQKKKKRDMQLTFIIIINLLP